MKKQYNWNTNIHILLPCIYVLLIALTGCPIQPMNNSPNDPPTPNPNNNDREAPVIVDSLPANNATGVANMHNGRIVIMFNENIRAVEGADDITLTPTGGTARNIPINNNSQLRIEEQTLTLYSISFITLGVEYTLSLPEGIVEDYSGNAFAGDTIRFRISEVDIAPPTLLHGATMPVNGATIEDAPEIIRLAFIDTIQIVNPDPSTGIADINNVISLSGGPGSVVSAEVQFDLFLVITVSGLTDGDYTLTLNAGAIQDTAENVTTEPTVLMFTVDSSL